MNIRDSYIHGADGKGVVKKLFFATTADVQANNALHVNDLVFLLADTLGTQVPLTIPTLNQNTTGYASSLLTVKSTSTNNYYLTFVDSNNPTAAAESFYTSGDIYFNPSTGLLTVKSVTVNTTFNYAGLSSDSNNADRKIWFSSATAGTPVVNDDFKYNPSTKTLSVNKINGPTIKIGGTTLYLDGANNVLTPDTVINNTSTNNTIPSSKAVWDAILTGMQANDAMIFRGFLTGGADVAHTTYTPGANKGDTYKVQTAGYINGKYYQVNDTFICTTDGTVAATSSNVTTISANWGVVEGNGDYLDIHGGTMYGTLSWSGTTALPTITTASSILVVDNNITKQISLTNLLKSVTTSAVISNSASGTTQITAAQSNPYYNLLEGGAVVRSVQFVAGEGMTVRTTDGTNVKITNTAPVYYIKGDAGTAAGTWTGTDSRISEYYEGLTVIFVPQVAGASTTTLNINGLGAKTVYYTGTTKCTTHYPVGTPILLTYTGTDWRRADFDSNSDTWRGIYIKGTSRIGSKTNTKAINFDATGNLSVDFLAAGTSTGYSGNANYFTVRLNAAANAVDTAGYVAAPTAEDNPNQVWMTNANGEPAWRTVSISSAALQVFSGAKTLAVSTWTDMVAVNTYSGTYAIQISDGTLYASGIFSVCGGTDTIIDEIPLHVSSTGATWRPYARISAGQLQMTTNEATGTARTYTIKILKLI